MDFFQRRSRHLTQNELAEPSHEDRHGVQEDAADGDTRASPWQTSIEPGRHSESKASRGFSVGSVGRGLVGDTGGAVGDVGQ